MAKIYVPPVLPGEQGRMIESDGKHDVFIREYPDGTREYDRGGMAIFIGPGKFTDASGKELSTEEVAKRMETMLASMPKRAEPDPKDVMKIQQFLRDRQLYDGPVDGKENLDMVFALKSYEDMVKNQRHRPSPDADGNWTIESEYTREKSDAVHDDADPDVADAIDRYEGGRPSAAKPDQSRDKTEKRTSAAESAITASSISPSFADVVNGVASRPLQLNAMMPGTSGVAPAFRSV